jgi:hypothetical protein
MEMKITLLNTGLSKDYITNYSMLQDVPWIVSSYLAGKEIHNAGPNGWAVCSAYCLQPLKHWDHGFDTHLSHGCMSAFFCVVLSCV